MRPDPARFPIRGVDVSRHQGEIDWAGVASEGWRFAYLKASEGGDWRDPRFEANRQGARAAGLPWGAYHFYTFCRPVEDQVAWFLEVLGEDPGDLPPVLDVEMGGNCATRPPPAELAEGVARWTEAVEAATGRPVMLYILPEQLERLVGDAPALRGQALWVRDSFAGPPAPVRGQPWVLWQYHARAWVRGIRAFTDLNVFAGDEAAFEAWVGDAARGASPR